MANRRKKLSFQEQRELMVKEQLEARGIRNPAVLNAMRKVPRHLFVPSAYAERAYDDCPLPIGEGQTISQPYMVAWMTELLGLEGGETVLEIGAGSGYQAAVLADIAGYVYTVERIKKLADRAGERLSDLGVENVELIVGDGSEGLPEHSPYRGIMVTAGAPDIPPLLVKQLAEGGRLVVPVGSSAMQMLTVVEKSETGTTVTRAGSCVFVPLLGKHGWKR